MGNKQDFLKLANLLSLKNTLRDQLKYFNTHNVEKITEDDFYNFISNKENNIPKDKNGYIDFEKIEKDGGY